MKTLIASAIACIVAIFNLAETVSQQTKFQKWQTPSFFKGFNMSVWDNYDSREVNQEDFDSLKAIGANLVALQTQGIYSPEPPYNKSIYWTEGTDTVFHLDMLDRMVEYARNAGLHYILSVREGPGRYDVSSENTDKSTVWVNKTEQQLYGSMLKELAARFLPDELFAGIDMAVEPTPLSTLYVGITVNDLDSALKANSIDMKKIFEMWIDSVRTADQDLPLLVEGVFWSNPEYYSLLKKQSDERIIYKVHLYNPHDFSHAEPANSAQYPGEYWSDRLQGFYSFNKEFLESEVYKPVLDFQADNVVPVMVGEFGLLMPQQGGMVYLKDIADIACAHGWHYALWMFNDGPGFNYKDMDNIYGTDYYGLVKQLMNCTANGVIYQEDRPEGIRINPNPASDFILIDLHTDKMIPGDGEFQIYNCLGFCVGKLSVNSGINIRLDISGLPAGVYCIKAGNMTKLIFKR